MDGYLVFLDGRLLAVYQGPGALIRAWLTCGICLRGRLMLRRIRRR